MFVTFDTIQTRARRVTETADPYLTQRRIEILDAARAVFVRRGFERATMQEIADEVGISAGAIYRYFPSKEALITTVCGAAGADYMSAFDVDATDRSTFDILADGGAAVWSAVFGPHGEDAIRITLEATLAAMRAPEAIGDQFARQMAGEVDQLAALVERAQSERSITPAINARSLAATLIAVTQGMQLLHSQLQGDVDVNDAFQLLVRMVEGLQPSDD